MTVTPISKDSLLFSRQSGALPRFGLGIALLICLVGVSSGCKKRSPPAPEKPSAVPAPAASAAEKVVARADRPPVGPRQMVVPGRGITAIRFGATVETIERHMQAPCDVKTELREA